MTGERRPHLRALVIASLLALAAVLLRLPAASPFHQPDDAYITYRYAANLAAGRGFVYNTGERVLGTTSPLLALLLSGPACVGLDVPVCAGVLSMAAGAACCALVFWLTWLSSRSLLAGTGAAALLLLSGLQRDVAVSGMEPALLGALMLATVVLVLQGRLLPAGLCLALAALTRPEGLLWLVVCLPLLRQERRWQVSALAAAVLPVLAWAAFAQCYFGSPLPQSLLAKLAQGHTGPPLPVLPALLAQVGRPLPLALLLLIVAALAARRDPRLLVWPVFGAAFVAGYSLSRPMIYGWYAAPLGVGVAAGAGVVLGWAAEVLRSADRGKVRARREGLAILLVAFVLLGFRPPTHALPGSLHEAAGRAAPRHPLAAQWLRTYARPGDRLVVGDLGYVGYYNLDKHFYDYYGLVWRAPGGRLKLQVETGSFAAWVNHMVALLQPQLIVLDAGAETHLPPAGYRGVRAPPTTGLTVWERRAAGPQGSS